jgi:RNA polymerase sigma-70 factor (ECF subfamily)
MASELDELTLARARKGDSTALAQLIRHYQRPVFSLAARLLVGRGNAAIEDAAQEAFIRVIRGIHGYDPQGPARLSTWILTVATRTYLNLLRVRRREEPLDEQVAARPANVASPEDAVADREQGRRLEAAMAALPEDMRAVLVLRAYHDLDYPEIAQALGLELGTVKSRLARARAALRDAVGGFQ